MTKEEIEQKVEEFYNSLYGKYFDNDISFMCDGYRQGLIYAYQQKESFKAENDKLQEALMWYEQSEKQLQSEITELKENVSIWRGKAVEEKAKNNQLDTEIRELKQAVLKIASDYALDREQMRYRLKSSVRQNFQSND